VLTGGIVVGDAGGGGGGDNRYKSEGEEREIKASRGVIEELSARYGTSAPQVRRPLRPFRRPISLRFT
jgi:hypothetical protein